MPYVKLEDGSIVKSIGDPTKAEKDAAIAKLQTDKQDWQKRKQNLLNLVQEANTQIDALQTKINELKM